MKEASGELSMTAVAVVAIAAVSVLFTTLIWPSIKRSLAHNTACSSAYACKPNGEKYNCLVVAPEGGNCSSIGATGDGNECNIVCSNPNSGVSNNNNNTNQ